MRKSIIFLAGLSLMSFGRHGGSPLSGNKMGLYLSPADFQHSKLSYAGSSANVSNKIKVHDGLFGSSTVTLTYEGKKQSFSLDQVYGYRDAKGQDFRFFGRDTYKILDTAGFYIYSTTRMVQGEKIARPQTMYFFSVEPGAAVMPLNLTNLGQAFAGDPKFVYEVESLHGPFGSDASLAAYDDVMKVYKIKYLYAQTRP